MAGKCVRGTGSILARILLIKTVTKRNYIAMTKERKQYKYEYFFRKSTEKPLFEKDSCFPYPCKKFVLREFLTLNHREIAQLFDLKGLDRQNCENFSLLPGPSFFVYIKKLLFCERKRPGFDKNYPLPLIAYVWLTESYHGQMYQLANC